MKVRGCSLSEIADELGYEDAPSVSRMLKEHYQQEAAFLTQDDRMSLLALEFGRLERIVRANMLAAEAGDIPSASVVMKAVDMQIKLTRLDQHDSATDQARVLVVGGLETDYVNTLKEMSDG